MRGKRDARRARSEPRRRRPAGQPRQRHHRRRPRRSTRGNDIDGRAARARRADRRRRLSRRRARGQGDDRRFAGAARRRRPRLRRARHREGRRRRADQRPPRRRASWPATIAGLDLRKLPRRLGVPALATRAGGTLSRPARRSRPERRAGVRRVDGRRRVDRRRDARQRHALRLAADVHGRGRHPRRRSAPLRHRAAAAGPDRGAAARPRSTPPSTSPAAARRCRRSSSRGALGVPHAAIVGGDGARRGRRRPPDARRARRHAHGVVHQPRSRPRRRPAAARPAPSADRIDAAMATPSITAFSLPDTTGRVQLTLQPSRVGDQHDRSRRAAGDARRRRPRRRVARRRRPARRRHGARAQVALTRDGASTLQYRVVVGRSGAGGGAGRPGGRARRRARSRARSPATSPSCTRPARWPCRTPPTARRRGPSTPRSRYDVTLPDLDAQRIRVEAQTRAALVEAAGQSLREVTADVRYADRAAAFSRRTRRGRATPRHAATAAGTPWRCRSRPASTCASIA